MKTRLLLLLLAVGMPALAQKPAAPPPSDLDVLLQHAILPKDLPTTEAQNYCEPKVPRMPKVTTLDEWQTFAGQKRREALDKIVFRGALAKQWRDAKTKVEWLDTIEGGPGYHIRKLRYEILPGLWIPALLYQPDKVEAKMPVHLAVNGHDGNGKASPYKQIRCINLAKRGIASLNIEWFGMGQLRTDGFTHARMNQLDLCGVSGLAPFYLSMSRGLDILLALPNADPARVAASGVSGGGWQTIIISSLDTRVTLCNPVAGYSSYRTRAEFPSDLGDSEQTPNDLATVADYTHLTAMLGGRAALLTYNVKDDCCFASGHALQPMLDAAEPIFKLYGQPEKLRSHVNYDPGTHNYLIDNRQAFYRMIGDIFYAGDTGFDAKEIPSDDEVKKNAELDVPLPADNLDVHQLAMAVGKDLPRDPTKATRGKLAEVVKYHSYTPTASRTGEETRSGTQAVFWKLRMGGDWTVPVTELTRGNATGTTIVIADNGRRSAAKDIETLLASGQRVLAVDPFQFGESNASRGYLYALLVATVGDRALGIEAGQVAAVSRWANGQFQSKAALHTIGPRSSIVTLVAKAMEPQSLGALKPSEHIESLHGILRNNWMVSDKPELYCFGLLEFFDVPQLQALADKPD
ncbi:MAG: acetylxylan esterase [Prosthecobacter sp.]|uniref:alpha/beta hydrolase family protein n=1 Tax=Prosthecobacter sp. TaxID=1965333 RepID=UPI0025FABFD0|nr:acetylxylan esterase [Prosthecobacter sp.]MCF7786890.1 acetylxylan esterase [Prosthecobacter sp.]